VNDPNSGLIVWSLGIAALAVILAFVVRAVYRLGQSPTRGAREEAELEALRMRVDVIETDLQAFDASYEQLKQRTEFTERLLERKNDSASRTT